MNSVKWIIGCCAVVCFLALAPAAQAETDADRLTSQGDKLLDARKFEEALVVYQQALDKDWEHCGAMYGQGRALFSLGEPGLSRWLLEAQPSSGAAPQLVGSGTGNVEEGALGVWQDADPRLDYFLQISLTDSWGRALSGGRRVEGVAPGPRRPAGRVRCF